MGIPETDCCIHLDLTTALHTTALAPSLSSVRLSLSPVPHSLMPLSCVVVIILDCPVALNTFSSPSDCFYVAPFLWIRKSCIFMCLCMWETSSSSSILVWKRRGQFSCFKYRRCKSDLNCFHMKDSTFLPVFKFGFPWATVKLVTSK